MPRTKTFSSSLATIRDLSLKIVETIEAVQDDFDRLSADSKRLKDIEPALLKLQNAINPPAVPIVIHTGESAATGETDNVSQAEIQPDKPKRQRAKKEKASDGTNTGTE